MFLYTLQNFNIDPDFRAIRAIRAILSEKHSSSNPLFGRDYINYQRYGHLLVITGYFNGTIHSIHGLISVLITDI